LLLIDLILTMRVYFPMWHSHCTRARFTVLVSCNDELAVHSFDCRTMLPDAGWKNSPMSS